MDILGNSAVYPWSSPGVLIGRLPNTFLRSYRVFFFLDVFPRCFFYTVLVFIFLDSSPFSLSVALVSVPNYVMFEQFTTILQLFVRTLLTGLVQNRVKCKAAFSFIIQCFSGS